MQGSSGGVGVAGESMREPLAHAARDDLLLAGHARAAHAWAAGQIRLHGGPLAPSGIRHVQVSSFTLQCLLQVDH